MIGPLAQIIIASNSFKTVLRYFGKVWHKSNVYIMLFDWLIALYIFTLLPRNASFLILKNSCVREEVSDFNKSLCKNIFLVSSRLCTSPLVRASPQLTLSLHLQPLQCPVMCAVDNFWRLIFYNSQSPDKFTGNPLIVSLPTSSQESMKCKPTFTFTFTLRIIYEVNGTAQYIKRCWPSTNNDAILSVSSQHKEDNFSKLTVKNRSKIDCNKSIPNKW